MFPVSALFVWKAASLRLFRRSNCLNGNGIRNRWSPLQVRPCDLCFCVSETLQTRSSSSKPTHSIPLSFKRSARETSSGQGWLVDSDSSEESSSKQEGELSGEEDTDAQENLDRLFPVDIFPKLLSMATRTLNLTLETGKCNPLPVLRWRYTLALVQHCQKHAVKRICPG